MDDKTPTGSLSSLAAAKADARRVSNSSISAPGSSKAAASSRSATAAKGAAAAATSPSPPSSVPGSCNGSPDARSEDSQLVPPDDPSGQGFVSFMRKILNKDVDSLRISIPLFFLEPASGLEFVADLGRIDDFVLAPLLDSPIERLLAVLRLVFASLTRMYSRRHSRKPFNPVLGETLLKLYDCVADTVDDPVNVVNPLPSHSCCFRCRCSIPVSPAPSDDTTATIPAAASSNAAQDASAAAISTLDDTCGKSNALPDRTSNGSSAGLCKNCSLQDATGCDASAYPETSVPPAVTAKSFSDAEPSKLANGSNRSLNVGDSNAGADCREKLPRVYLIGEQVSHHPPISVFHLTCPERNVSGTLCFSVGAKFNGLSFSLNNKSFAEMHLADHDEHYFAYYPDATVAGILSLKMRFLWAGSFAISCPKNKLKATLNFKDQRLIGKDVFDLTGKIEHEETGETIGTIFGAWNGDICYRMGGPKSKEESKVLCTCGENSVYTATIDPSSSCYTIWGKVFENMLEGDGALAKKMKLDIENNQRAIEKLRQAGKLPLFSPRFFRPVSNDEEDGKEFDSKDENGSAIGENGDSAASEKRDCPEDKKSSTDQKDSASAKPASSAADDFPRLQPFPFLGKKIEQRWQYIGPRVPYLDFGLTDPALEEIDAKLTAFNP